MHFYVAMAICGSVALSSVTAAQGIASAALGGRVLSPAGIPLPGAQLSLTNIDAGTVRAVRTGARGRFGFENVPIGRYRLEARAIGWAPGRIEPIDLHLGDRLTRDIVLGESVAPTLERVLVTESALRDAGAGGPAYLVPGEAVGRLPLRDRNFLGLLAMAPQATGAGLLSVSGQNPRFNAIQVDGGSSGDFFGVNATPGSNAGAKVISLEALEEIRILVAPFDVRQGGFSGGLINAVTRSGTNTLSGSAFATHSRNTLVGSDTGGAPIEAFNLLQYGVRLGGPLVRDRLHFFVVADLQARSAPFVGPVVSDPTTGINPGTAERATRIFRDRYGFDAGTADPPVIDQPNGNLLVKLSWQPSSSHWVELSHGRVDARTDVVNRTLRNDRGWQLSGSGYVLSDRTVTTRFKVGSEKGALSNELLASLSTVDDKLQSRLRVPLFLVQGDVTNNYLAGGSVKSAAGTATSHRVLELTDNLSWSRDSHVLTIGTQNQLLGVRDNLFLGSWGVWTFNSVDALDRGEPSRYEVALPLRPGGPLADFSALQLSGYAQDRWTPRAGLTLTLGIRADAPLIDHPRTNPTLAANDALDNIDTGVFPSGNVQWAPRLGFAWDLDAARTTTIRGGVGAFTGHPLYVWLATAFANTGLDQALLICAAKDGVPAPTTDLSRLPTTCLNNLAARSVSTVAVFSPRFRYQQSIKYALGVDRQLGRRTLGSIDLVHSRSRDQLSMTDVNLIERGADSEGRMMYGAISATGGSRPTRRDSVSFGPVYRFENASGDHSTAVTVALQKSWSRGGLLHAGYSWSRSIDRMGVAGFNGATVMQNSPIAGTLANRALSRSSRDVPHNLSASAVMPMRAGLTTSFFLRVRSGAPYAWTVTNDANADTVKINDLLYVPRDSSDITLSNPQLYQALDEFIETEPCLREQRGRILARGSCRNPTVFSLDGSVSKSFGSVTGRRFEVRADVFNLPNLLNGDWGIVRETSNAESKGGILSVDGWDAAANRPRYAVTATPAGLPLLPGRNGAVVDASRWRMQLNLRYEF